MNLGWVFQKKKKTYKIKTRQNKTRKVRCTRKVSRNLEEKYNNPKHAMNGINSVLDIKEVLVLGKYI